MVPDPITHIFTSNISMKNMKENIKNLLLIIAGILLFSIVVFIGGPEQKLDLIISLFNSSFFAGIATILTGTAVIFIYFSQKNEKQVQAARILSQEIRDAETNINIVSEKIFSKATQDLPQVLPVNNWKQFSHLFAKEFDQDQLKSINHFYTTCEIIQDMITKQNNFFWTTVEERQRVVQQKLAEMVLNPTEQSAAMEKKLIEYENHAHHYSPMKTLDVIEFHLKMLQKISSTQVGEKLKQLSC